MARVGPRRGRLPRLRPCRRSPSGRLGWHKEVMEPHRVRFSQHRCSPRFRNGLALTELVVRLASGFSPQAVPPMRLIWAGKHWVSLDNRRLACFRIFNILVRLAGHRLRVPLFRLYSPLHSSLRVLIASRKWSSRCRGRWIRINHIRVRVGRTLSECRW